MDRRALLVAAVALGSLALTEGRELLQTEAYIVQSNSGPSDDPFWGSDMPMASVISNIWVGAFALASITYAIMGLAVALQWPNPRCCCYKTPYSDLPASGPGGGRACCSLNSLNVGFLVAWVLMLAIMAVSRDLIRIAVCAGFVLMHGLVVAAFRWQFKRKGRPAYPESDSGAFGGSAAVGVPLYHIPMTTATIGGGAGGDALPPTWGTYPPPPPGGQQQQQQQQPGVGGGVAGGYPYPGYACGAAPGQQAMPQLYGGGAYPVPGAVPQWGQPAPAEQGQQQQQPAAAAADTEPQQQQQQPATTAAVGAPSQGAAAPAAAAPAPAPAPAATPPRIPPPPADAAAPAPPAPAAPAVGEPRP